MTELEAAKVEVKELESKLAELKKEIRQVRNKREGLKTYEQSTMKYGEICSGINAPTVAVEGMGWKPVFFSEIEPFPSAVSAHHYPEVPNAGDFTTINADQYEQIDLLIGGTPCQSFSMAGLRGGMDDERGNLTLEFAKLADRLNPAWFIWENVPGVFSIDSGETFGRILSKFAGYPDGHVFQCPDGGWRNFGIACQYDRDSYGLAWRVLDAQYVRTDKHPHAIPQRRRRVFVVGYRGDWRRAAAVLFEPESLQRNNPTRRKKESVASALTANGVGTCGADDNQGQANHLIASPALNAVYGDKSQRYGDDVPLVYSETGQSNTYDMRAFGEYGNGESSSTVKARDYKDATDLVIGFDARGSQASVTGEISGPLRCMGNNKSHANDGSHSAIAFAENSRAEVRLEGGDGAVAGAVSTGGGKAGQGTPTTAGDFGVRRLMPIEAERLMGVPDGYTAIPWKGKPAGQCPDTPRYKALGNSMCTNVIRWIAQRIEAVQSCIESSGTEIG